MDKKLAVLGSPIDHSKSPAIHAAAYRVLGLPWKYEKFEVREGGLRNFVESLDDQWLGLSLTMPLKDEAARFAQSLDSAATQTGAVNTLVRRDSGWSGFNTDVFGIVQAIQNANLREFAEVLVIGSGATAKSALAAIVQINPVAKVKLFARNADTRADLVSFGVSLGLKTSETTKLRRSAASADLVISTLPAGALDEVAEKLSKARFFRPSGAIFDVAYKPWPSKIAKVWLSRDRIAVSGLEMLVWQAVAQIRIFSAGDVAVPLPNEIAVVEAMRHAVSD